jgi:hypothetical protein
MKQKWKIALAALFLCLAAVFGCSYVWAAENTVTVQYDGTLEYTMAAQVLDLVNQERAAEGLSALIMDADLQQDAMKRAEEIAIYFSHTRPNGTQCFTALTAPWYWSAGENIAAGQTSASAVMTSWMNSPGHRANILDEEFGAIGIGCFSHEGQLFWVQMFLDSGTAGNALSGSVPVTATVDVLPSLLNLTVKRVDNTRYSSQLTEGKSYSLVVQNKNAAAYYYINLKADLFDWTVNNANAQKLQVTQNGCTIRTLAAGDFTVYATYAGQTASGSFTVSHAWNSSYTIDKEATCTESGQKSIHCSVCNQIKEGSSLTISAKGHSWDSGKVTVNPTCTTTGKKIYTCSTCKTTKEEILSSYGHKWNASYTIDKTPTCTETGSQSIHCSVCNEIKDGSVIRIAAKGHSWDSGKVTVNPTCTTTGKKVYTCTTCKTTKEESVAATGHKWNSNYTIDKEATCTETGSRSIHCSVCNEIKSGSSNSIAAKGHSWDSGKVTVNATCTTTGKKVYTCTTCKTTKEESVAATGHKWNSSYTVDKAATCTAKGVKSIHCSTCNEIKSGSKKSIAAAGHKWNTSYTVDKAATCTAKGVKSIHCSTCNEIKSGSKKSIAATGHKWSAWKTTTAASYTKAGKQTRTCSRCKKTESKAIAKKVLKTVAISTVKSTSAKKVTVSWKKVADATGYQVYCKVGKNGKYKLLGTTTKLTYTQTKTKAGTVYYYKVRAYRKVASNPNKYVYGSFSTAKYAKSK